jgi:hypothetical protein
MSIKRRYKSQNSILMRNPTHYFKMSFFLALSFLGLSIYFITPFASTHEASKNALTAQEKMGPKRIIQYAVIVPQDVRLKDYFAFINNIVKVYDTLVPYDLTEHLIVRHNPWIIDTLENTDYYHMKARGKFVYDQKQLTILKKGDILFVPTEAAAKKIIEKQAQTLIDVNIPEFKLRIIEGADTLYTLPVRVGQMKSTYWAVTNSVRNLKTHTGRGKIVEVYFKQSSIDPKSGKKTKDTRRDDGKKTLMPLCPWIEPEIKGERLGQLIHPTTNLQTLNKAYSNGCVGTREGDIWRIYYHAPIGTAVFFRYHLFVNDEKGNWLQFKDVYGYRKKR